jgi:hypothetical protein
VGKNRRYESDLTENAINAFLTRPRPISLSEEELGHLEPVEPDTPPPVVAWVRYPEAPIRVQGEAVAFTDRAVLVRWLNRDGSTHQAWVWRSAVSTPQRPGGNPSP